MKLEKIGGARFFINIEEFGYLILRILNKGSHNQIV